jgi:hypothetical protein
VTNGSGRKSSERPVPTKAPAAGSPRSDARARPTSEFRLSETRKTGWQPGLSTHRRQQRQPNSHAHAQCSRAPDGPHGYGERVRAQTGLSVIASVHICGAGDDFQPHPATRAATSPSFSRATSCASRPRNNLLPGRLAVSCPAIAAALALREISPSERLVAFSLASFANHDQLAWPSNPVAIGRAGLSRSQYLHARDRLTHRGFILIAQPGGGRGRSTTIKLDFALAGPWWDGPVNPQLFEAVLSRSSARGPARQLLAAIAAMADANHQLSGVTTDELRLAAGLADSTYRRARAALVSLGDVVLQCAGGGRGRTNRWHICRPSVTESAATATRPRRVAPAPGSPPLLSTISTSAASTDALSRGAAGSRSSKVGRLSSSDRVVRTHPSHRVNARDPQPNGVAPENGAHVRTASSLKGPDRSGVSLQKGAQTRTVSVLNGPDVSGVSLENTAQTRTVSGETPPQTPPETPPPNARARKEPQNQRTPDPPNPPEGGNKEPVLVEETYLSARGRRRRRTVQLDLSDMRRTLGIPTVQDITDWQRLRDTLARTIDEGTFEIWLQPLELIAVDDASALVINSPPPTRTWIERRFGPVIAKQADELGRQIRFADELERCAMAKPMTTAEQHRRHAC